MDSCHKSVKKKRVQSRIADLLASSEETEDKQECLAKFRIYLNSILDFDKYTNLRDVCSLQMVDMNISVVVRTKLY